MEEAGKELSCHSWLGVVFPPDLAFIIHPTLHPVRELNTKMASSLVTLKQLTTYLSTICLGRI